MQWGINCTQAWHTNTGVALGWVHPYLISWNQRHIQTCPIWTQLWKHTWFIKGIRSSSNAKYKSPCTNQEELLMKGARIKPYTWYGISLPTSDWWQNLVLSRESLLSSTASSLTIHYIFLNSHGFQTLVGRGNTCPKIPLGPDLNLYGCSLSSCGWFISYFRGADWHLAQL